MIKGIIIISCLFIIPLLVYFLMEWDLKRMCRKVSREAWRETQEYMKDLDKRTN